MIKRRIRKDVNQEGAIYTNRLLFNYKNNKIMAFVWNNGIIYHLLKQNKVD